MTELYNGQITDLLNNGLRYNPETISISYAILQEKRRILALAAQTRLMSAIDTLSESTLDYLAVELRTPAYRQSHPIETKRKLVAGTIPFYAKLGTPAAVDIVIDAIFAGGHTEEWFEYGGEPHHFRVAVNVTGQTIDLSETEEMRRMVNATKRLTSWLDELHYVLEASAPAILHLGGAMATAVRFPVPEATDAFAFEDTAHLGGGVAVAAKIPVPEAQDTFSFQDTLGTGGSSGLVATLPIPEQPDRPEFRSHAQLGGAYSVISTIPVAEHKEE
ncbi:MAG: phage tail protein I [Elusimicrobiales bacterium]|nr:phage tail protein I [Elusimicrobiales bacterium]